MADHGPDHKPFPVTTEDFEFDPRVSFSRLSNKWTLETESGAEFEYDEALRRWIPVLDEEEIAQQQAAYRTGDATEDANDVREQRKGKKRKQYTGADQETPAKPSAKKPRNDTPKKVSSVYVTNLPRDATTDEIKDVFSRCGVISEDIDTGKPRIKLYLDADGKLKGDALITYFRPESVTLAVQMLDETDLRFGVPADEGKMRVQAADFSYKEKAKGENGAENGNGRSKQLSARDKKKVVKKTQKLNNKLADWDDDDPSAILAAQNAKRFEKVVILKHMFTLEELEEDPAALLELKEDIREECEKLGEVTNLTLYDKEADGVVSVKFKAVESAQACVRVMDGRFFAGQRVIAYIYDGNERFRKSGAKAAGEEDEDEKKRLEKFGDWLENDN